MDYPRFQIEVAELADEGTTLTTMTIVARLLIEPDEVERHLRRMVREERLEVDEDASTDRVVAYRVRGLSPRGKSLGASAGAALKSLGDAAAKSMIEQRIERLLGKSPRTSGVALALAAPRKISTGALVAGVLPGIGLAYAAPWKVVAIATVAVVVGWKVLAFISLMLAIPFLVVAAIGSAVLGGLYTWQYNQMGRRADLKEDPDLRKLQGKLKL